VATGQLASDGKGRPMPLKSFDAMARTVTVQSAQRS
jgi:hypothetical protein